ncbi:hypothetical protein ES705_09510 [subsurface metagenome]
MVILYILGLVGWIAVIFIIFGINFHDYTKDKKVRDIKDKIDRYLLKQKGGKKID